MQFRILEFETFKPQAEIDTFLSYSYSLVYGALDNLILQVNKDCYLQYYKINNIIWFSNTHFFFIKQLEEVESENGETIITITAISPIQFLNQRLIYPDVGQACDIYNKQPIETVLKTLINKNVVNPSNANRGINFFSLATDLKRGGNFSWSFRYQNLLEIVLKLADFGNLNILTTLDIVNKKIVIDVANVKDLTTSNIVVFSKKLDNITDVTIYATELLEKNCNIVGDYKEGKDRTFYEQFYNNKEVTGVYRKENFFDGSGYTGEQSANYVQEMLNFANLDLVDKRRTETIEFVINNNTQFKLFEDFNLGDIVWIIDKTRDIKQKTKIAEIRISAENGNKTIELGLGNPFKSKRFEAEIIK